MFLNHRTYEDIKELIGPDATLALANHYNGQTLYFPAIQKEGRAKGPNLMNGLRHAEVRSLICSMRRGGATAEAIVVAIKTAYPDEPEKWVTKSSMSRFFISVRSGRMREFGISDTFRESSE